MKNFLIIALTIALAASLLYPRPGKPIPPPTIESVEKAPAPPAKTESSVSPPPVPSASPPLPEPAPSPYALVEKALREVSLTPGLAGAALGFCLLDSSGNVVVDLHAGTAQIPASVLKTVTTATAIQRLGPDFRFVTQVKATAPLVNGVVKGDLILIGEGDPLLSMQDLEQWVAKLKEAGLKQITGRIIGDGGYFTGSLYDDFWNWGDIGNGYGSAVSGLNLEHNRFQAIFRGGAQEGSPATFTPLDPVVPVVKIVNAVTSGPANSGDNVVIYGGERTGLITARGTVPMAEETIIVGAVPDPELFAAWHFRRLLKDAGISVGGDAVGTHSLKSKVTPISEPLIRHESPPLIELITSIHATSDNQETECLFRKLGLLAGKDPEQLIKDHWKEQGLEFIGLRMEDGCGLARADHIRPLDLARLQFLTSKGPHGQIWKESLLSDGPVRSKIGAMSSIRCWTGFIDSKNSGTYCFALMVNHYADGKPVVELWRTLAGLVAGL